MFNRLFKSYTFSGKIYNKLLKFYTFSGESITGFSNLIHLMGKHTRGFLSFTYVVAKHTRNFSSDISPDEKVENRLPKDRCLLVERPENGVCICVFDKYILGCKSVRLGQTVSWHALIMLIE